MSVLEAIAREVAACNRCDLAKTRNLTVPGEGSPEASIMLIGEAPGWYENQQGRPFVGAAGQLLRDLLGLIGLQRSEVFIANVVKCRPPQNRDPLPEEIAACSDYLERQITAIRPKLIVTLGRYSMARFFPAGRSIRDLHGSTVVKDGVLCFAMYHPAAALHQPSLKPILEQDMLKIPALVSVAAETQASVQPIQETKVEPPEQLSLF